MTDEELDGIEARAKAIMDNQGDGLKLSAAIDTFDATAVDDVLNLVAEVRRLRNEPPASQVEFAAEQRDLGIAWCIDSVRKSGLPWSHRIAERLEALRKSVR